MLGIIKVKEKVLFYFTYYVTKSHIYTAQLKFSTDFNMMPHFE